MFITQTVKARLMRPYFKVKKLRSEAKVPSKRAEDAAYDFYATLDTDFLILRPGEVHLMPTGIATEFPRDWVLYVAERGSTGSRGIAKRAGVVDSGYRGELFIATSNASNKTILFHKAHVDTQAILRQHHIAQDQATLYPLTKAIAQGMLLYAPHVDVEEVSELSGSERGEGRLGSSGK